MHDFVILILGTILAVILFAGLLTVALGSR
jgi:hypothetical protein